MKNREKHTMNTSLATFTLLVTSLALAVAAGAQSTTPGMATFICRPALSGEKATAEMMTSSIPLVCKPFALAVPMSDGSMKTIGSVTAKAMPGPDFSGALTVQQANAAYHAWVLKTFHIDPAIEHTN
jgi:hypothetical protein